MNAPHLTIDDIVENVEARPGTSLGIPKEALLNTWNCCSETIAEALINHKSLIVPQFAHFIVQKQQESSGTWGVKTTYIPSVVFLSAFSDSYGIRKVPVMRHVHVGASVPITINMSVVSAKAGLPRHAATNSIRDIVREVGNSICKGKTGVRLNMGFCEIAFAPDGSYNIKWEEEFAQAFAAHYVPCAPPSGVQVGSTNPEVAGAAQRPATTTKALPSSVRLGRYDAPPVQANAACIAVAKPKIPAPPKAKAKPEAAPVVPPSPVPSGGCATPSIRPSSARSDRSVSSQRSNRGGTPRGGTPRGANNVFPSQIRPGSMSPRRQMDIKSALDQLKSTDSISRYQRNKTRKTLYRHHRNKAYEESWENQAAIKRAILEEEKEHDRQKVAEFKDFIAAEHRRQTEERIQRRAEDKQMEQMNHELAGAREKLAMPRAVENGDIFDARQPTYSAGTDHRYLRQQIQMQEERRRAEKEEDRKHGERASRAAEEWKAKANAEIEHRKKQQQIMCKEYDMQVSKRAAQEKDYKSTQTSGGALVFSGDDGTMQEKVDRRRVQERSREIQMANKKVAIERSRVEKEAFERQRQALMESQAVHRRNDALLRAQNRRTKDAIKDNLRSSWDGQIQSHANQRQVYKEAMKVWKEHNYLKNESSDDDE